jgi:endoglucanase
MIRNFFGMFFAALTVSGMMAQDLSDNIVIDQFGYRPGDRKVAVIRDPRVGYDAGEPFTPGEWYAVVNANSDELIFRGKLTPWNKGQTDASSGDRVWHFDFSEVDSIGNYYILDQDRNLCSFEFRIAHNIYNEVLRQAMRTFFYQRAGHAKEEPYADAGWTDGASHSGDLQDNNCRSFFDQANPATERDVSGGWYDAGDFNKYSSWTASYVVELLKAFLEKPDAWGDDYNIPESGNGKPDILDEAIWGIDHLLRMQQHDGSVLSIVGEAHASPPSSASGPSYYGPPNTSATLNTSAALALASGVYREQGLLQYADTLLDRSVKAWNWAELNPDSLFYNNNSDYASLGLGAGQQETDDYGRLVAKLAAAAYLFEQTGQGQYRDFFDAHYQECKMFIYNGYVFPFEAHSQEVLLYYAMLSGGSSSVQDHIRTTYRSGVVSGDQNLPAYTGMVDPYFSFTNVYTWGSNGVKSSHGSILYNLISYGLDGDLTAILEEGAESYLHNLHGVNPLNFVYLSNMYDYGAEQGVNEFYHTWFSNGSPLWDRVGVSVYGPAPGFLTGGPNPSYDWDGCCPGGCGSSSNNQHCYDEVISPPKDQPDQKSYKDFNNSWPLNSWSVTENSCGYQTRYIRLLSKYVTAGMDCYGEVDGDAFMDSCGVCAGGSTGITPSLDPDACMENQAEGDTMYIEGRFLYSAAGEKVILHGVNEMFVWSGDKSGEVLLPEIAKTGANCVRLVWTSEEGNKDVLGQLIDNCVDEHMIAMPECHSATGEWDKLDTCINFWKDSVLRESIRRNKRWTLLNIGNEIGDHTVTEAQFKTGYKRAIDSLRGWGYRVPLVIDASSWGQDVDMIFATWKEIQAHDPLHNVLFSVHSYWGDTQNYSRVATESVNGGLPIIVGEGPSPTRYPSCEMLDYGTGLELCGQNEIGWLPWSWGGIAGNHCVPNFDLAVDGVFGDWKTAHSADMMVDHAYSLMRISERPASFFPDGIVPPGGIHLSPDMDDIYIGDTVYTEVLVSPANAFNSNYSVELSGDVASVDYDPGTGRLFALQAGVVQLTAISEGDPEVSFSRTLKVNNIAVSSLIISPSEAELLVDDTLYFSVELLPENATVKELQFETTGDANVLELDAANSRLFARQIGVAELVVRWRDGEISDTLSVRVSDNTLVVPESAHPIVRIYPNPGKEMLFVECDRQSEVELNILDLDGTVHIRQRYNTRAEIDTAALPPGNYVVVHRGSDFLSRLKLIIL